MNNFTVETDVMFFICMLKIGAIPSSLVLILLGLDETSCEFKQHIYKLSVEWLLILIEGKNIEKHFVAKEQ